MTYIATKCAFFRMNGKAFLHLPRFFTTLAQGGPTKNAIYQSFMRNVSTRVLIHGFAILHAVVTILCLVSGLQDALLLTLLSMTLTVLICARARLSVEFTAISVILVNIGGFILGMLGADFFGLFSQNRVFVHSAATFATTEIMGWSMHLFAMRFHPTESTLKERWRSWNESIGWLVFAVLTVFFLRLAVNIIFTTGLYDGAEIFSILSDFLSNSLMLIILICLTTLFISYFGKRRVTNRYVASAGLLLFISVLAVAAAAFHCSGLPFRFSRNLPAVAFMQVLPIAVLTEVTLYAVIYMISFAAGMHNEVVKEREKTHQAEFRYMTLKQQVNPHFLFNSLNILDSLITDGRPEDASRYTHMLAGIYRYMLQHEGEKLVPLSEEIQFADMYKELLLVRFPAGLRIETDIPEDDLSRCAVPCSLQLLIENAIKHNTISSDTPLVIRIVSDGSVLSVSNNINPKTSAPQSTGLGLKYIRQQYCDLTGSCPEFSSVSGEYSIRLPLI